MSKLKKIFTQLMSYPKRIYYKNISLVALVKNSDVAPSAKISPFVKFYSSSISDYSYIGWNTIITDVDIGKYCSIAGDCVIGGASHPISWVSTSPLFYKGKNIFNQNFSNNEYGQIERTLVKNDVWIAANVIVKQGITIENGAVIGMGSVVTKDIGEYEIWAGNPAKKIGNRFPEDIKERLISSEWWNLTEKELLTISKYFNNPEKLLKELEEGNNENTTY